VATLKERIAAVTRTIEVPIPDELLKLVDEKARTSGLKREDYIRAVLSREVKGAPSLGEILAPFRQQVEASGASEEDLARLFSTAREESHRDKNR
jgi:hypothetical protein